MTFKRWLISLTLLLLLVGSTFAQDASQPLIIIKAGDLWEWTGGESLRQKTQWGYNSGLEISPITDEVAYSSVATLVVEYMQQEGEGFGGAPLPNNLWVMKTASDEAIRIADQPADASFGTPNVPDTTITRSGPIWSPNGQEIAWTEPLTPGGLIYRVVIYHAASQTTRILPTELGTEDKTLPGIWTHNGLILKTAFFNNSSLSFEETYVVLNPETGAQKAMIRTGQMLTPNGTIRPMKAIPVVYDGNEWLAILYMGDQAPERWMLYNLETGEGREAPDTPRAFRFLEGVDIVLSVVPLVLNSDTLSYNLYAPNGNPIPLTNNPKKYVSDFALSPDGQAIAYHLSTLGSVERDPTIYVWRNGVIGVVPQTGELGGAQEFVWAQETWIVSE